MTSRYTEYERIVLPIALRIARDEAFADELCRAGYPLLKGSDLIDERHISVVLLGLYHESKLLHSNDRTAKAVVIIYGESKASGNYKWIDFDSALGVCPRNRS
jgi:hypothetical protein